MGLEGSGGGLRGARVFFLTVRRPGHAPGLAVVPFQGGDLGEGAAARVVGHACLISGAGPPRATLFLVRCVRTRRGAYLE